MIGILVRRGKLINAISLKITWLACVLGGSIMGLIAISAMILHSGVQRRLSIDLPYVGLLSVIGFVLDTAWISAGVLDYGQSALWLSSSFMVAPPWIVLLWVAVGLSLNQSLSFLVDRPLFGSLLVGLGAPFSYLTGESFGAVVIPDPSALVLLSLSWIIVFYGIFYLARVRAIRPLNI